MLPFMVAQQAKPVYTTTLSDDFPFLIQHLPQARTQQKPYDKMKDQPRLPTCLTTQPLRSSTKRMSYQGPTAAGHTALVGLKVGTGPTLNGC